MQAKTKHLLALLLSMAMVLALLPASAFADGSVPFSVTANGEEITAITSQDRIWYNWDGSEMNITVYTVSVPEGTAEATLDFPEEKQWTYYTSSGEYIADGDTSWVASASHTVALQDSNSDGELDAISVQIPESYSPEYCILFAYAAAQPPEESCLSVKDDAPVSAEVTAGGLYQLKLAAVFADAESHSLSYSFESTVENEHTKIVDDIFFFSVKEDGTYEVTFTAACDEAEVSHMLSVTVTPAPEGIAAQYGYDETAKSSVTVYVTLSNDGYPILAADGTPFAHKKITVPYFDLGLYGLEDYYRYGTENGKGPYVDDTVIQRPTGLHLYLYLLERYYMGLPEEQCCLGASSGVLSYAEETEVLYMDGSLAYESDGKRALYTSGGATSIYMVNFFGHSENLMYFRNHCYPLMDAGWGSTSDYILLSDGDAWDVGLFSDWTFNANGKFACFDQDAYTAEAGESITVSTKGWGTTAAAVDFTALNDDALSVAIYNSDWEQIEDLSYSGGNSITFKTPEENGTYYLMALDHNATDISARIAPATARLTVGNGAEEETAAVSRILLNTYEETLIKGTTLQLTPSVLPAEASGWTIGWSSSDSTVVTVSESGLVTAVGEGEATVTAAIGDISASCKVNVAIHNSAPSVVAGSPTMAKIKTNTDHTVNVASMFTDAEQSDLTYSVSVCKASGLTGAWNYLFETVLSGYSTEVVDGAYTVSFKETGIYALKITAGDGKLSTTHTYVMTVVDNDAGTVSLGDGITADIFNVVVVDASTSFVEGFEIQYKGTHDAYIHDIVLSRSTLSGTPSKKLSFTYLDGFSLTQYESTGAVGSTFSFRGDMALFVHDRTSAEETVTCHYLRFHTECAEHKDADGNSVCDSCTMKLESEEKTAYGDLDGNGSINMADVALVLQYIDGAALTDAQFAAADVNGDSYVNMMDVSLMLQYIDGAVTAFPKEQ